MCSVLPLFGRELVCTFNLATVPGWQVKAFYIFAGLFASESQGSGVIRANPPFGLQNWGLLGSVQTLLFGSETGFWKTRRSGL